MTTKVTVDAHAGWDVEVKMIDTDFRNGTTTESVVIVPKFTTLDFYITSHRYLSVKEIQ